MTNIPVAIIAGGSSQRFGSPKGLARIENETIISIIIDSLGAQTTAPIVINTAQDGPYSSLGLECVPDPEGESHGPLSGLQSVLLWANKHQYSTVATVPVDVPFLPNTYLSELNRSGAPSISSSRGRLHYLCGIWGSELHGQLSEFLHSGKRAAKDWIKACSANVTEFPNNTNGQDPFFNINSRDDLNAILNL